METFFDKVVNIIKNNYFFAIALGIGYILGHINNIISFIDVISKRRRLKNKLLNKNTPYVNFNKENFEKETNVRFGFSFLYPKTWDRKDPPTNSDGNIYIHPKNQDIKMYAWGNYNIEESLEENIEEVDIPESFYAKYFKRKKIAYFLTLNRVKILTYGLKKTMKFQCIESSLWAEDWCTNLKGIKRK